MKILYIANVRIPTEKAHGHQIMKVCETLSDQSVDLKLVLPTRINKPFKGVNPYDFYNVKNNFKIQKIWTPDPTFLLKFPAGLYIKFQSLFFIKSLVLYFLLTSRKDKIVYTRDEYLLPFLQLFFKSVVWEAHALPNKLDRYVKYLKKCHKIVVLTGNMKKQLIDVKIAGDNILVSPDAVDLSIFDIDMARDQARKKLGLPEDDVLLGYTGSFKTKGMDKGISDILKSLKLVNSKIKLKFMAVGGNEADTDYYKQITGDLGVGDRVEFISKVDQKSLAIYQKAFDILLMPFPYTKHYANFMSPLKMFEYLAARRPIVATKLPTILEILDNRSAYLIEPDNPGAIARAIEDLVEDHDKSQSLADTAYDLSKKYTWKKRSEEIVKFIAVK
jgi:glycosyltransferase involved in cell wall biosynthesis